jgi:hypothetical protein
VPDSIRIAIAGAIPDRGKLEFTNGPHGITIIAKVREPSWMATLEKAAT